MDRHLSPRKTPLAREWLERRDAPLERAHRSLLITVDGRRTGRELVRLADALGLGPAGLEALEELGLIEWPTVIVAPAPVPAPAPAGRAAPSLAAAKLYAMDLATLMLGGQDRHLRALAADVQTRDALEAWCELAARAIEAQAGAERAERFLEKTTGMLAPVA